MSSDNLYSDWKAFIKTVRSELSSPDKANKTNEPFIESVKFIFDLMKDYRNNYYSKCSEVLNAHNWFIEKMTDEYQYATDDAYTVGIEKGIDDEYCDVLQPLGIEFKVCFRRYYTSVDNMLSLYEKYGSPQKSIRAVITAAIDSEISVTDIFENFYEYKDDDTFNSRFNYESEKLLDELYENLVDEEDGVFL